MLVAMHFPEAIIPRSVSRETSGRKLQGELAKQEASWLGGLCGQTSLYRRCLVLGSAEGEGYGPYVGA